MQTLSLEKSLEIISKQGIKTAQTEYAQNKNELAQACNKIGFPLAIKVISNQAIHKTEHGGVAINIQNLKQAQKVFSKMQKIKGFEKVAIQKMLKGTELIIGAKRDIQFGPTIIVGLGGIYVEILQDYSIGICPLTDKDATEMLKQLKTYKILTGARTKKPVNLKEIKKIILKIADLMEKNPNIEEIDLNPIIANKKEATAVDARIVEK